MKSISLAQKFLFAGAISLAAIPGTLRAASLQLSQIFSDGSVAPAATGQPWLTVTTTDTGTNVVLLELEAPNLTGGEYVNSWYLNLDPSLNAALLTFSLPTSVGTFDAPTISAGTNAFKADGDGLYDLVLSFSTSNSGGSPRFTDGDKVSYFVSYTGAGSVNASSFIFQSAPDGGSGPFYSAAHIGTTGPQGNGSAWISPVPEPSSAMVAALAGGLLLRRRRTQGTR